MISKEQLNRIAIKSGLSLYQQEKDYLLKLFLYYYYKHNDHAVFKGGTALKYLFGLNRFSEDLDFNIKNVKKFQEEVKGVLKELELVGIQTYSIKEEIFKDAYTSEIGFQGPLYKGTNQTRNRFRIDAGYRLGTLKKPEWKIVKNEYPETEGAILILCMAFEEIFTEKIIALQEREKGRDMYDLWFLINKGVCFDQDLLHKKAKRQHLKIKLHFPDKTAYERDLSRLTTRVIPYGQVRKAIEKVFRKIG
ncbi:nucleotidyl transferase AbiEii/AbiGii toxin family protein [archaeon]|nr:nucleotidyl transferase AbiEii/AbiGii toxin family protein [archaeon]